MCDELSAFLQSFTFFVSTSTVASNMLPKDLTWSAKIENLCFIVLVATTGAAKIMSSCGSSAVIVSGAGSCAFLAARVAFLMLL